MSASNCQPTLLPALTQAVHPIVVAKSRATSAVLPTVTRATADMIIQCAD